jgi:transposase-like protein
MNAFKLRRFHALVILQCVRWHQGHTSGSWRVDETCMRVNGEWNWLFLAVDKQGRTIDFLPTGATPRQPGVSWRRP